MLFDDCDYVFAYTREDAVADGVLVRVPAEELALWGIKYDTCVTYELWAGSIEPDEATAATGSTAIGRLRVVLGQFARAAKECKGDLLFFDVPLQFAGGIKTIKVKSICGPGDTPEAVLTLMLPDQD